MPQTFSSRSAQDHDRRLEEAGCRRTVRWSVRSQRQEVDHLEEGPRGGVAEDVSWLRNGRSVGEHRQANFLSGRGPGIELSADISALHNEKSVCQR